MTFAGYLGTPLLLGIVVCGFLGVTPWIILLGSVVSSFIGLHAYHGKALQAKEIGRYWNTIFMSIPLHLVLMALLYGVGWLINYLINLL